MVVLVRRCVLGGNKNTLTRGSQYIKASSSCHDFNTPASTKYPGGGALRFSVNDTPRLFCFKDSDKIHPWLLCVTSHFILLAMTSEHNKDRPLLRASLLALLYAGSVSGTWMGSNSDTVLSNFGNTLNRDWLYDSTSLSIQVDGCIWGYVSDNEDAYCMEDRSSDGTTYWYQMANCRRAQVAFSMYGSSSSSTSCTTTNFKESVR